LNCKKFINVYCLFIKKHSSDFPWKVLSYDCANNWINSVSNELLLFLKIFNLCKLRSIKLKQLDNYSYWLLLLWHANLWELLNWEGGSSTNWLLLHLWWHVSVIILGTNWDMVEDLLTFFQFVGNYLYFHLLLWERTHLYRYCYCTTRDILP
jgi:hypothetical protein